MLLFLFFIFSRLLFAHSDGVIATFENDPSVIVGGVVNAITGQLCIAEEDLVIRGAEPIRISRSHLGKYSWLIVPITSTAQQDAHHEYRWEIWEHGVPMIYKQAQKVGKQIRFESSNANQGFANTYRGEISSRTNLKNSYFLTDKNFKRLEVHAADGTLRRYKKSLTEEWDEDEDEPEQRFIYRLEEERLPHGNWVIYEYEKLEEGKNREYLLSSIRTMNPSRTLTYARADFSYDEPKIGAHNQSFTIKGSDGQVVRYDQPLGILTRRSSSAGPDQELTYGKEGLLSLRYPEGRGLFFSYHSNHKIESLSQADQNKIYTFSYTSNTTSVFDGEGNRTDYHHHQKRPQRVEHFSREGELLSTKQLIWGSGRDEGNLIEQIQRDAQRNVILSKKMIYDHRGNVLEEQIQGEEGSSSKYFRYAYGEPDLLIEERDDRGKRVVYEYLPGTDLLSMRTLYDREQQIALTSFFYNADHILVKETHDDGVACTVRVITPFSSGPYLQMPWIIEEKALVNGVERLLKKTVLTYTTGGRIAQKEIYDAESVLRYTLQSSYDEKGRLRTQTNALGQTESFSYDPNGNCVTHCAYSGLETVTQYDRCNRPERVHRGPFVKFISYDRYGRPLSEMDQTGAKTEFRYDGLGRCIETRLPSLLTEGGRQIPREQRKYDCLGREMQRIDAEGAVTELQPTIYGTPKRILYPDGTQEEWSYDQNGVLQAHTDAVGVITYFTWDGLGRLIKKRSPAGEESFVYRGEHLLEQIDREGNRKRFIYDAAGRICAEEFDGVRTEFTYDALGRLWRIDCGPLRTQRSYDLLDRLVEEQQIDRRSGKILRQNRTVYDAGGNPQKIFSWVGTEESCEERIYDSVDRLVYKRDPTGAVETDQYHDVLGTHMHTDAMGVETLDRLDARGHLLERTKTLNQQLLSREEKYYTLRGALALQKDTVFSAEGSRTVTTRWRYDCRGRLVELIEGEGSSEPKVTRREYTPRGECARWIKPDETVLSYTYDASGNLIGLRSSDGTVDHRMTYNCLGQLITSDGVRKTVNARGLVEREEFPSGVYIEQHYDALGRRTVTRIPQADCLIERNFTACDLESVTRKTLTGVSLYTHRSTAYDLSGHLLAAEFPGSLGTIQFGYDLCQRPQKISAPSFSQEVLEFNRVGAICRMRTQQEESVYTYDALSQLTSESSAVTHSYRYDSLYNRLQKDAEIYQVNALHQIVSHWKYDANGDPIELGDLRCHYDALDRLIRIEGPDFVKSFEYDFEHRCLSEKVDRQGECKTRYFLYEGNNEIGSFAEQEEVEELRILGETPHAERGAAVALELNKEIYVPIHDVQGNITQLLDLTGAVVGTHRYTAFGEESFAGTRKSPWRFSSKRCDKETGWIFFGRRWYSPKEGRWLTPDPAGFSDGMNLYAFVHNDPLTHFDEYGLLDDSVPRRENSFVRTMNAGGRQIASQLTHELYTTFYMPFAILGHELYRTVNPLCSQWISDSCSFSRLSRPWTEERMWEERRAIDRFFGTRIVERELAAQNSGLSWTRAELPAPTQVLRSSAKKISEISKNTFLKNVTPSSESKEIYRKSGRNKLIPDVQAGGSHTVFRRDPIKGTVMHYETFALQTNPYDPKPWESIKRFDGTNSGKYHFNKNLGVKIYEPHVHDPNFLGGVRSAYSWEIPK